MDINVGTKYNVGDNIRIVFMLRGVESSFLARVRAIHIYTGEHLPETLGKPEIRYSISLCNMSEKPKREELFADSICIERYFKEDIIKDGVIVLEKDQNF